MLGKCLEQSTAPAAAAAASSRTVGAPISGVCGLSTGVAGWMASDFFFRLLRRFGDSLLSERVTILAGAGQSRGGVFCAGFTPDTRYDVQYFAVRAVEAPYLGGMQRRLSPKSSIFYRAVRF